jgi:hypothetical protein
MQEWLVAQVLSRDHQEEQIREQAYQWFKRMCLEAPTPHRFTRQIRSAAHTFEQQLYESTIARLPLEAQTALNALLGAEEQGEDNQEGRRKKCRPSRSRSFVWTQAHRTGNHVAR